ncbi:MAG: hypothetical protein WC466_06515 [Candidatus Izemoplasmatales bacterium]
MDKKIVYNGTITSVEYKLKKKLFFIEELLEKKSNQKVPVMVSRRISKDVFKHIESRIKSYYFCHPESRVVFKSYKHFKNVLEEAGINIKNYL